MPLELQDKQSELLKVFEGISLERLTEKDPLKYLEARRMSYIKRLEAVSTAAEEIWTTTVFADTKKAFMDISLKANAFLLRLTSVYKTKVDVTASNLGLIKPPDMSKLSQAELEAMERGDELTVTTIAKRLPDPDDTLN
jgi:hypothetical protein